MIAFLFIDNFMVWVVAATYTPSHKPPYPEPLQDNGRIIVRKLAEMAQLQQSDIQLLRNTLNVQWTLVSAFTVGLVGCELKLGKFPHRSMWALGIRAFLTLGIARFVRAISFSLTVMPSQIPSCYVERYPYPVPDTWVEWIMVGLKPAARGGCNDLVVSGHATVTSTLASVAISFADNTMFSTAVWSLMAFDYLIEVYQGFHYSVDMWLGGFITALIFRSLESVEVSNTEDGTSNKFLPLKSMTIRDAILFISPALLAFVILSIYKPDESMSIDAIANLWIVLYVVGATVASVKGEHQLSRHILWCTLYIGFVIYL